MPKVKSRINVYTIADIDARVKYFCAVMMARLASRF